MITQYRRHLTGALRPALTAVVAFTCLVHMSSAVALDEAEIRGKQVYFEGTSPRGDEIDAIIGDESIVLPGSVMPCAGCHGSDGLGRPEGGVLPPDIRWSVLVKSYGHVHENGRRHGAYDEASFARSMTAGVDPANKPLDRVMPLYLMSGEDMADLIAYMKVLEHDLDPGVDDSRVQVATLLPLQGSGSATGQAMARVMQGHFANINEQGGVFGRRIELLAVPLAESPGASLGNLREAFDAEGVFALVGAYTIGLDDALLTFLREDNVPLVGPFTLDPGDAFVDAAAFYLYSGFDEQVRVLADRTLADGAAIGNVVVAGPEDGRADELVSALIDQLRHESGDAAPSVERYTSGEFDTAAFASRIGGSEALVFLGPQTDLQLLLTELASQDRSPRVYVLSSHMSRPLFDAPVAFDQKIFVAYPTLSSDITPEGLKEYQELAEHYSLPREHIQAQLAAFAAAKVLVEGLRRAGRDLSRVRLVEGLEQLYTYQTGVTPPLTYGPNRRIGARGAHVVAVDIENRTYTPVGDGWHELR